MSPSPITLEAAAAIARKNAPYLAESLALFPDVLAALDGAKSPELRLAELFAELPSSPLPLVEEMSALRTLKRRIHLTLALLDISNIWSWVEVTEHLTQLADLCMARLLHAVAVDAGFDIGEHTPVPGLFILAVGKYGGRELNYSSDIDFNVFYDPEVLKLPDPQRAERVLIRLMQKFIRAFEQDAGEGYIFRTDLRLRPDPRSNAIVISTQTAERYYEVLGQNWERAAMIKARVCAGDAQVGAAFIKEVLCPFIWRRNLDYAAIEDIHSIKRQMQSVKGLTTLNVAGHNLKLGLGGIREIEFFVQVQQLILGGRSPELRTPRTVEALRLLANGDFVNAHTAEILTEAYGQLRKYEHAAQMREDHQTHVAPEDESARAQLAAVSGFPSLEAFDRSLKTLLIAVHEIYSALFPESDSLASQSGSLVFTGVEPDPATLETLRSFGFSDPDVVWKSFSAWLGGRVPATRSERARELLTGLTPKILKLCRDLGAADAAFAAFSSFFTGMKTGRTTLTMFARHPERLHHVMSLMLASPRIRETIAAQPRILDVMSEPDFLHFGSSWSASVLELDTPSQMDFETVLDRVRQQVREDHFKICAATLSHRLEIQSVPTYLSDIADGVIESVLPSVAQETIRRFGDIEGDFAVLGMGKLGGRELSLSSDLDIMLVYQPRGRAAQGVNFTRLTQRLVSALSVQTAEGGLYAVDMALRPSGRAGPVAVSLESFRTYYAQSAWTWEFMALSRARVIAASRPDFAKVLSATVQEALHAPRSDLTLAADILDMRARTAAEKPPKSDWDMKEFKGGLRDIEYIAQASLLACRGKGDAPQVPSTRAMLSTALQGEVISDSEHTGLVSALQFYADVQTIASMISTQKTSDFSEDLLTKLALSLGSESVAALAKNRDRHRAAVRPITQRVIGLY